MSLLRTLLLHPLTSVPTALGTLSGAAWVLTGAGALQAAAAGGLALGAGAFLVNGLFRRRVFHTARLEQLAQLRHEEDRRARRALEKGLELGRNLSGCEARSERAVQILDRHWQARKSITGVLDSKLNRGEITYQRYSAGAGQVMAQVLLTLEGIAATFKAISGIDPDDIRTRLKELSKTAGSSGADSKEARAQEAKALEQRLALREAQLSQVDEGLAAAELAMTRLDEVAVAIAQMRTSSGDPTELLQSSLKELEELARRARAYRPE